MDSFELHLIKDNIAAGRALALADDGINRVIYVVHGAITIDGQDIRTTRRGTAVAPFASSRHAPVPRCGAGS